jgi:hypothetical protein
MDRKHMERMREIACGNDSSNPLEGNDADIAAAIIYLLEKRIDNLTRDRTHHDELDDLKRRVEELERKHN